MKLTKQQLIHRQVMQTICEVIQQDDKPLVLKGGTALLLGYNLDRFSEDLDFDLAKELTGHVNIEAICKAAQRKLGQNGVKLTLTDFKVLKKTDTTHKCRALFDSDQDAPPIPLKIEVSSRSLPKAGDIRDAKGIKVYSVHEIARQKLLAAREDQSKPYRTAARDLHDLAFMATQYESELTDDILTELEDFFISPEILMERYAGAYSADLLLDGRLFEDLGKIEHWLEARMSGDDMSTFFGPS